MVQARKNFYKKKRDGSRTSNLVRRRSQKDHLRGDTYTFSVLLLTITYLFLFICFDFHLLTIILMINISSVVINLFHVYSVHVSACDVSCRTVLFVVHSMSVRPFTYYVLFILTMDPKFLVVFKIGLENGPLSVLIINIAHLCRYDTSVIHSDTNTAVYNLGTLTGNLGGKSCVTFGRTLVTLPHVKECLFITHLSVAHLWRVCFIPLTCLQLERMSIYSQLYATSGLSYPRIFNIHCTAPQRLPYYILNLIIARTQLIVLFDVDSRNDDNVISKYRHLKYKMYHRKYDAGISRSLYPYRDIGVRDG